MNTVVLHAARKVVAGLAAPDDQDRLRAILRQALPMWREGSDTATIAWFLTIDSHDVVRESEVATALARYRDGLLTPNVEPRDVA